MDKGIINDYYENMNSSISLLQNKSSIVIEPSVHHSSKGIYFPILLLYQIWFPSASGEFQILKVDLWTRAPIFAYIGTFEVPLLTYVPMKTHKKWVPCTSSDKDILCRLSYIKNKLYLNSYCYRKIHKNWVFKKIEFQGAICKKSSYFQVF